MTAWDFLNNNIEWIFLICFIAILVWSDKK